MKSKVSTPCPAPEQGRNLPGDIQGWSLFYLLFLTHYFEPPVLFS